MSGHKLKEYFQEMPDEISTQTRCQLIKQGHLIWLWETQCKIIRLLVNCHFEGIGSSDLRRCVARGEVRTFMPDNRRVNTSTFDGEMVLCKWRHIIRFQCWIDEALKIIRICLYKLPLFKVINFPFFIGLSEIKIP